MPLFQCSELKGGDRRPNQSKTVSFRPHSRSIPADPNPTGLTGDLFFVRSPFSKGKIIAKTENLFFEMTIIERKISVKTKNVFFLEITIFEEQKQVVSKKKSSVSLVDGTFRELVRFGIVFQNCPLFGQ